MRSPAGADGVALAAKGLSLLPEEELHRNQASLAATLQERERLFAHAVAQWVDADLGGRVAWPIAKQIIEGYYTKIHPLPQPAVDPTKPAVKAKP